MGILQFYCSKDALGAFTIFSTAFYTITIPSGKIKKPLKKIEVVQCAPLPGEMHTLGSITENL